MLGSLYTSFTPAGKPVGFDGSLLMCALGSLYTSFAPAGDPPSQSSGTLMSLQEGIAVLRARMGLQQALSR